MSFEQPLLLLTLLVVAAAAAAFLLLLRRRSRYAVRFTNVDVLARLVDERSWRRYLPAVLFLLALASLCVAVARPHVKTLRPTERATVVLVIDQSRSMQSQDVRPSRLAAAQAAARAFLERVPKRLRVGLVVFAGDTQVGAPPTTDRAFVRASIDAIGFPGFGGTAIGDAIARAVEVAQEAVREDPASLSTAPVTPSAADVRGLVSILFLSDGRQNRGLLTPLQGAARARAAGIPVHTVALGTANATAPGPYGSRRNRAPDPATLRAIARTTNGQFFAARTAKRLQDAYAKLGSRLGRTPAKSEITYAFLAGASVLLLGASLLSARWSPRMP